MSEKANSGDKVSAGIITRPSFGDEVAAPRFRLTAKCIRDGKEIWSETFGNVVTTEGKIEVLDQTLGGGTGASWFMGLISSNVAPVVGDTAASHVGWGEHTTGWTGAPTRKTCVFGSAAASGTNGQIAITQLQWAITATITVYGAFIQSASTGTGGLLYSAGLFGQARQVVNTDTLQIDGTWTIT